MLDKLIFNYFFLILIKVFLSDSLWINLSCAESWLLMNASVGAVTRWQLTGLWHTFLLCVLHQFWAELLGSDGCHHRTAPVRARASFIAHLIICQTEILYFWTKGLSRLLIRTFRSMTLKCGVFRSLMSHTDSLPIMAAVFPVLWKRKSFPTKKYGNCGHFSKSFDHKWVIILMYV